MTAVDRCRGRRRRPRRRVRGRLPSSSGTMSRVTLPIDGRDCIGVRHIVRTHVAATIKERAAVSVVNRRSTTSSTFTWCSWREHRRAAPSTMSPRCARCIASVHEVAAAFEEIDVLRRRPRSFTPDRSVDMNTQTSLRSSARRQGVQLLGIMNIPGSPRCRCRCLERRRPSDGRALRRAMGGRAVAVLVVRATRKGRAVGASSPERL